MARLSSPDLRMPASDVRFELTTSVPQESRSRGALRDGARRREERGVYYVNATRGECARSCYLRSEGGADPPESSREVRPKSSSVPDNSRSRTFQKPWSSLVYRSSTRVCVRNCVSIRRPEFECSGPQLEGPEFECSGPQLEGPEFEYSGLSLKSLMLAGSEFQSLGSTIVKEDEYEEVRWDGIVSIVSWRERVFRLCGKEEHRSIIRVQRLFRRQQDGAPPHFANMVRTFLDEQFPARWIGRGSPYITWPARSPDLTPPDFFLWGFLKDQVYRTPVRDLADLQERIYAAVNNVTPQMLHNTWVEVEYRLDISRATNGSHVEVYGT
ncbi:hypothetical protein ANN_27242 [Periplaneta americana]|uniref:Uncharacterized protein n=1 Tax=Periplaneta americana TaxID=6978 RepID=A0ABQ8RXK8_PERAM|nr:hypothetical protein ANN_27242 [Periplaneta americana]